MVHTCATEKVHDAQVVLKQSEVPYVHQSISQLLIRKHLVCDVESASIRPFEHYLVLIQPLGPGSKDLVLTETKGALRRILGSAP